MRALTAHIEYRSVNDVIRLKYLTDIHLGTRACDEALLESDIAEILADPNAYAILGGDVCEFINRGDRRFRQSELAPWLQGPLDDLAEEQIDYAAKKLTPLAAAGKILAVMSGNHEMLIFKKYERDVYYELVKRLRKGERRIGLGYQGFLTLYLQAFPKKKPNFGAKTSWRVVVYLHHGYGGGRLEGGHALTLGRIFKSYDFDLALLGHRHVTSWVANTQLVASEGGGLRERKQIAAFCGSYRRSYREDDGSERVNASYEEEEGYPPHRLGTPWFHLIPRDRDIKIMV